LNRNQSIAQGVDWSAPWLSQVREAGQQIASSADWRGELNRRAAFLRLSNHQHCPIRFVEQRDLPSDRSYEAHISATGCVPTRDNLHDFFNALIWLTFPAVKARLNALQAAQIAQLGVGKSRGPARDAATLFDENAAILAVTDDEAGQELVNALRSHQWDQVFVQRRDQFAELAEVVLFGHAIMEKLVQPYKAITAHTLICRVDAHFHQLAAAEKTAMLDARVAQQLASRELLPAAFSPLPVLGVPGWWPQQDRQFYADTAVFRPRRDQLPG